mmetsp:Transcript_8676/g.26141  ORF Transcript_8676/g.26141 Transcript_8676/m.26141 type:complete len:240 (+) Transcript_8676:899-1618(+)
MPLVSLAISAASTSAARGLLLAWTMKIASLASDSGRSILTFRSNLPGLTRASSKMSMRLVAAMMTMFVLSSKPSISLRSWFTVWSLSSLPSAPPLFLPTASSSSMKTMAGASCLAVAKTSLTLAAPTPMNISTNSEALMERKLTPASPATALAMSVFPFPGGPSSRTPLGTLAPTFLQYFGFWKKSTISWSWYTTSGSPATSLKVTVSSSRYWNLTPRCCIFRPTFLSLACCTFCDLLS